MSPFRFCEFAPLNAGATRLVVVRGDLIVIGLATKLGDFPRAEMHVPLTPGEASKFGADLQLAAAIAA